MKFKAGNYKFKAPPIGLMESALWVDNKHNFRMAFLDLKVMQKMRFENPDLLGVPVYFAIDGVVGYVYPAPAKDGEMKLRYYPPAVEA